VKVNTTSFYVVGAKVAFVTRGRRGEDLNQKGIERGFVDSGWEVCESSSPHLLLVGQADDLSILAYRSLAVTEDPVFELIDRRRGSTYWFRTVPTPRVAAVLLEERGEFMGRPLMDAKGRDTTSCPTSFPGPRSTHYGALLGHAQFPRRPLLLGSS
jgi:hypothetical protein